MVRTLQAHFPETRITWILGKTEAALAGDLPGIEFITFDKRDGLRGMREIRRRLAGREFDVLLHMQAALRASLLSRFVPAATRIGFDTPRARDFQWLFTNRRIAAGGRQHVMDALFGFAEALGASERVLRWDIPLADADLEFARAHIGDNDRALVVSPSSSIRFRNYRNWSPERYAAVCNYANSVYGLKILLTGGPGELERAFAREVAERTRAPVTDLSGRTTLKQLLALLERARALLCPDSGPAHMATTVGTPVIGLYASSNPARTGPYFSREWTVDRYPEALWAECRRTPEQVRWGRRVRDPGAMQLITVEDVTGRLDALLAG